MSLIKHPVATEKGIRAIEAENKIVFIVDSKATKLEIKAEVERMLNAKVLSVNTFNGPDGQKKAHVKFSKATPAIDIATRLGIM